MEAKRRERLTILCREHGDESVLIADSVLGDFTVGEVRALLADSAAKERVEALTHEWRACSDNGEPPDDLVVDCADELEQALGREDG